MKKHFILELDITLIRVCCSKRKAHTKFSNDRKTRGSVDQKVGLVYSFELLSPICLGAQRIAVRLALKVKNGHNIKKYRLPLELATPTTLTVLMLKPKTLIYGNGDIYSYFAELKKNMHLNGN